MVICNITLLHDISIAMVASFQDVEFHFSAFHIFGLYFPENTDVKCIGERIRKSGYILSKKVGGDEQLCVGV